MTEGLQPPTEPEPIITDTDEDDEDVEIELIEPESATRISPYAIAALATALLGLLRGGLQLIPTGRISLREAVQLLPSWLLAFSIPALALWLAGRAEDEIFLGDGRFGGVGIYRAARIIGYILLALIVIGLVIGFLFPNEVGFRAN